ncbi:Surfeit locus protein 6 [Cryptosporidium felis]|nr:Surfeit locus protein 6 [Cryptosporidium felis]
MTNTWRELGSFSTVLGYIPYNILLASENTQDVKTEGSQIRKEKFGIKSLLPTFGRVRDYFDAKSKSKSLEQAQGDPGTSRNRPILNPGLTRNNIEERLANKIKELKQNQPGKKNKQNNRKVAKSTKNSAEEGGTGPREPRKLDSSLEFGRIIDSSLSAPSTADYLQKKESKMKKINDALSTLRKEEKLLEALPEEEKTAKIKEIAMERAMKKAQGLKVKDSKAKLLKSKKMIITKKKKSKQRWSEIKKQK